MAILCSVHGLAGESIHSPPLVERRADGTLPEFVTVEIKDSAEEAAELPIVEGRIPFDLAAAEINHRLPTMCGFYFQERRHALRPRV